MKCLWKMGEEGGISLVPLERTDYGYELAVARVGPGGAEECRKIGAVELGNGNANEAGRNGKDQERVEKEVVVTVEGV